LGKHIPERSGIVAKAHVQDRNVDVRHADDLGKLSGHRVILDVVKKNDRLPAGRAALRHFPQALLVAPKILQGRFNRQDDQRRDGERHGGLAGTALAMAKTTMGGTAVEFEFMAKGEGSIL